MARTLYDVYGPLDWCEVCGRLLNFDSPEVDCNREYCPTRESGEEELAEAKREAHGPLHNKGTEAGWH